MDPGASCSACVARTRRLLRGRWRGRLVRDLALIALLRMGVSVAMRPAVAPSSASSVQASTCPCLRRRCRNRLGSQPISKNPTRRFSPFGKRSPRRRIDRQPQVWTYSLRLRRGVGQPGSGTRLDTRTSALRPGFPTASITFDRLEAMVGVGVAAAGVVSTGVPSCSPRRPAQTRQWPHVGRPWLLRPRPPWPHFGPRTSSSPCSHGHLRVRPVWGSVVDTTYGRCIAISRAASNHGFGTSDADFFRNRANFA